MWSAREFQAKSSYPYVALHTRLVHDLVDVICGHTRLRSARCNVEHFATQPADLAHALLLLLIQDGDLIPVDEDLL